MNWFAALRISAYVILVAATVILPTLCVIFAFRLKRMRVKLLRTNLPSVIIALPIYGAYNNQQFRVWDSVLNQVYDGRIDFVFVCESIADPAFAAINSYLRQRDNGPSQSSVQVKVAGLSFHNSQKIHNMLVGMQTVPSDYYICMDDDIKVNPYLVQELVGTLCDDSSVGATTGYSAEIPIDKSNGAYLVSMYRLMNCFAFLQRKVPFFWGGCFCVSKKTVDNLKLFELWANGCYSEDMSGSAQMRQNNLKIVNPDLAMFANLIGNIKFKNYFDFVGRQYFVQRCYTSGTQKITNIVTCSVLILFAMIVWLVTGLIVSDWWIKYSNYFEGKDIKQLYSLINSVFGLFACLNIMGYSLKFSLVAAHKLQSRITQQPENKQVQKINHFKLIIMLIFHQLFTPIICAKYLFSNQVLWAKSQFVVHKGIITKIVKRGIFRDFNESLDKFKQTGMGIDDYEADIKQKL